MSVAIILASYNGEKFIGEQIDSIIRQDYTDWRLFVFDDCSSDGTESIVKEKQKLAPGRIEFIKNVRNLGSTKSFLSGLFAVYDLNPLTEYFMFCDQDDFWNSDKISISVNAIRAEELSHDEMKDFLQGRTQVTVPGARPTVKPVLAFSDCTVTDSELKETAHSFMKQSGYNLKRTDLAGLLMENKCIGCTVIMNGELVKLMREYTDPEMKAVRYHDWWAAITAAAFGSVVYIDRQTMLYRQHEDNFVGVKSKATYIKNRASDTVMRRKVLDATFRQGKSFYSCFGTTLRGKSREVAECFCRAADSKGLKKRLICISYGFLKSGLARNVGLMISL